VIGREDLIEDPRSGENLQRVQNRAWVSEQLLAWTRRHTTDEVVAALAGEVPVGPVNRAVEIFADPHVKARQMLVEVPLPGNNESVVLAGVPVKMTATPTGIYRRAPRLGEHTEEILAEAGLPAGARAGEGAR
jgi:crotonobetainyl-CoA:carnitine CoA-transferase CaiB-like acyl-CoA transferase